MTEGSTNERTNKRTNEHTNIRTDERKDENYIPLGINAGGITKIDYTKIDLVNDNVYSKFGLNLSIPSQDIEQKPNADVYQGQ